MSASTSDHRWTYRKDGGENFPVQPGDVWVAGPHRYLCGDILDERCATWLRQGRPDALYVDPPWTESMVSGYRTKAAVSKAAARWADLMGALYDLTADHGVPMVAEGGVSMLKKLRGSLNEHPRVELRQLYQITYYGKDPAWAALITPRGVRCPVPMLNGMDDADTPAAAIRTFDAKVVMDPMLGRGLTGLTADQLGARCIGMELSRWRMSCALTRLAERGHQPRLETRI